MEAVEGKWKSFIILVSTCIGAIASSICAMFATLAFFDINHNDLRRFEMNLTFPHWIWLTLSVVLFLVSLFLSSYGFYRAFKPKIIIKEVVKEKQVFVGRRSEVPSKLIIHSAFYGTGPYDDVSVLEKLNSLPKDGLAVLVDNNLVEVDPAPNRQKRLVVEYSYGNSGKKTVTRPESIPGNSVRLVLPEDSEISPLSPLQTGIFRLASKFQQASHDFFSKNQKPVNKDGEAGIIPHMGETMQWKGKFRGWYLSQFSPELKYAQNILASRGVNDAELNKSLAEMESWSQSAENVTTIVRQLRTIAANLEEVVI